MRKLVLVVIMALVSTLTIAAPALTQSQYDNSGKEEEILATGVIAKPGGTFYQYGTHVIADEVSGVNYALESDVVDLDSYVGQRVIVHGAMILEAGELEGGPALLEVFWIEPAAGDPRDPQTVTVTFELETSGEVPEGQNFGVDYPIGGYAPADVPLCTTDSQSIGLFGPACEAGGTYSGSAEVPAGEPVSFAFQRFPASNGTPENFYTDTRTFTEDAVVSTAFLDPGDVPLVEETIHGVLTNVSEESVVVDENPGGDPCTDGSETVLELTGDTEILFGYGSGEYIPASAEDLREGQPVEATYSYPEGAVMPAICPPTFEADRIAVLGDPGGYPPGVRRGSSDDAEAASMSVLPYTGGILPILGSSLALITGGIAIRRLFY